MSEKKWIHFFESVTAVLFVVSLVCYDEIPFEDVGDLATDVQLTNTMLESIKVFQETLDQESFQKTGFILFFNKADLMEEKIKEAPITLAFPEYKGPQEYKASIEYIKQYFMALNRVPKREMYSHFTTATSSKNVEKVFNNVSDSVLKWSLRNAGLVE